MLMESLLMEHILYTEMNEGNRQETPQYVGIWNYLIAMLVSATKIPQFSPRGKKWVRNS